MNPNLLNILNHSNKDIDNQQLMDYLAGKLSAEEKHAVEQMMAENEFMNDAVEGLETIHDKQGIQLFVDQMNRDLHKKLQQKKARKLKRKTIQLRWIIAAVVLILAIVIATWLMIEKYQHLQQH